MNNGTPLPYVATHPGELIRDELTERKMTQKQLSEMTGIKASVISETIAGKRSVSQNMAIALEKAFGIPSSMWMNLQMQYNLDSRNIAERSRQEETIPVTIPIQDKNLLREIAKKFGWACLL